MRNALRVLIADDDATIREGLAQLLDAQEGIAVTTTAKDGSEALYKMGLTPVDLVLLDVDMPVLDGIEAARRIGQRYPAVTIVMLSAFEHEESLGQSIANNVSGFLTKDIPVPQLVELLKRAHAGETVMSPKPITILTNNYRKTSQAREEHRDFIEAVDRLPASRRAVFDLLVHAKTNNAIAKEAFLSESTVRVYVSDILELTSCANRTELVAKAIKTGIA